MASLFGKRGDDERDRSSCGEVVPYPVSRLENWIRLLSPSVKGQRGCGEPLIPCIIATSKNRSRFFHLGKRLASNWYIGGTYFLFFYSISFLQFFFFFFTEKDSIDLNWKRFFVILFSNRERERKKRIVSRSFIEFTYKRESLQELEIGIFHELEEASRPAFPSSLLHRRITIRNAPRRRFLRGARVATSVVDALTSPATSLTRKGTEIANNGSFDEALFLQPSLASQQQISAFFHETNVRTFGH